MSNNDDDIDLDLDLEGDSFEDFDNTKGRTLGDLWRDKPIVKVGVIAGAAVLVVLLLLVFSGKRERPQVSVVGSGSELNAPPGTGKLSPAYVEAVGEQNETRVEEAIKEGGSALPTPIEPPIGRLTVPDEVPEEEDPLQRWRRLQEERLDKELGMVNTTDNETEEKPDNSEAIHALSEAMSTQMQAILETRNSQHPLQSLQITDVGYLEALAAEKQKALDANSDTSGQSETLEKVLLPAAQVEYAQIMTEANSDVPGPVLAQILSGPLAGSRVLGSFEMQDDFLTVSFDTLVKDGKSLSISAVALDPDTTLPGMATEVDHRYWQRIILPAAAAFVEGAANAISESGRTSIIVEGDVIAEETDEADNDQQIASGIEEAGEEVREIMDEAAEDIKVLVRIEAGTPMAILFLEPVVDEPNQPGLDDGADSVLGSRFPRFLQSGSGRSRAGGVDGAF